MGGINIKLGLKKNIYRCGMDLSGLAGGQAEKLRDYGKMSSGFCTRRQISS